MTGVKITKNVDEKIRENLGFKTVAALNFLLGVPYPLPDWYSTLSSFKKNLWTIYCRFGDLMTVLLFISNIVELFLSYDDIRPFVTCTGTVTYIICFRIKMYIYKTRSQTLEKVIEALHTVTESLDNNPVGNKEFFEIYHKYFKHVVFSAKGKLGATAGGVCTLAIYELIYGHFQDSDSKRYLPMFGWYPYDPYKLTNFEICCIFQLVSYLSFLLKDVVVDLLFLTILVNINTHLIYLRIMLGHIVQLNENSFTPSQQQENQNFLNWWIKHHQLVLKTLDEFKKITSPYLFYKYISVGIILFFGGLLVTTETEYDLVQQMIVLAINSSNLLQLYIFSVVGDEITENSLRLTENGLHPDVILSNKSIRNTYLFLATKCSRPLLIHFGRINPLCVVSFAQIVKITFSYFITIIQIRHDALNDQSDTFQNSTLEFD